MTGMTGLSAEAEDCLDRWTSACLRSPGDLPADVSLVQGRLIRKVGRADLDGLGTVYLKVMGFPRAKDRLRYIHRRLPASHEAVMLTRLAAAGISCPLVVRVVARRRWGLPHLSLLVTKGLDVKVAPPEFRHCVELACRLAEIGCHHTDLNPGNVLALREGGVAVLDLQSAHWLGRPLASTARLGMATKLCAEALMDVVQAVDVCVEAGLVGASDGAEVCRRVSVLRRKDLLRRIGRCLRTSTEFALERQWNGLRILRRSVEIGPEGLWFQGGRDLLHWWIGDRSRELIEGVPPVLGALFRKSWWLPGRYSVYIPNPGRGGPTDLAPCLLDAYEGYRRIATGSGELAEDRPSALDGPPTGTSGA